MVRAVVVALALLVIAVPTAAGATFARSASAAMTVATDTLNPPTNVAVHCFGSGQRITLTWTPTTDTYATGYVIYGAYNGTTSTETVAGRTTSSYSPPESVPNGTQVSMASVYLNWTSAQTAWLTVPKNCH